MYLPGRACGGQRAILGNQFSPSTEWVSGVKLKPSGLAAGALPTVHLAQVTFYICILSFTCLYIP